MNILVREFSIVSPHSESTKKVSLVFICLSCPADNRFHGFPGAMKNSVQDKSVQAHLFEYTCTMGLTPDLKFKFVNTDKGMVPTQILFCLKEKNAK